ncbi:MAG: phosphate ABC transporter permease subunit PstC [Armatimonadetes bacterium]|nr:phosphate ABC transporter permease subunit PstC [Armatimonadota bacterium]
MDRLMAWVIHVGGSISLIALLLIFFFLLREAVPLAREYNLVQFLTGRSWYPTSDPEEFGTLPLLLGSLWVTFFACVFAIPLGVTSAVFINKLAPPGLRNALKFAVEMLAAIPSVVLGFIGLIFLAPLVKNLFDLPTGLTGLTGAIMLAFMALPTIITIAEDAINAVPRSYQEASLALGANRWQTLVGVVLPSARSGIIAASMLGLGRAIGETMTVLMVTGNAPVIPETIAMPLRTMTATIAQEMGETVQGGSHYHALFAIGLMLFGISFLINLISDIALNRVRSGRTR